MTILDLSAAFDMVDHDLLLEVLNKRFEVKEKALKWYEQYLKPWKFKVSINNTHSKEQAIDYSVPQGSIQGAFLFNTYASTISDVIPTTLELMGYADDHSIKKPFKPGNTNCNTESDTITIIEDSMLDVKRWMNGVRLKLNESKTKFIYFGSRQQLKKMHLRQDQHQQWNHSKKQHSQISWRIPRPKPQLQKACHHQMQGSND